MKIKDILSQKKNALNIKEYFLQYSPYLHLQYQKNAQWLEEHQEENIHTLITKIYDEIELCSFEKSEHDIMRLLRIQKNRIALIVALYDIFSQASLEEVTNILSQSADIFVRYSFDYAFYQLKQQRKIPSNMVDLKERSGLIVVAMGKLGAYELNYSSDIDICIFFDPETQPNIDSYKIHDGYIKITQKVVRLLSLPTKDGYVYRTDLRLRPDPSSTKVAVSIYSAERYYERSGQNWERAAWIKARFITGDQETWRLFQSILRPFIWRKNLDYDAIQDIYSIIRQLHSYYDQKTIKVKGHDIKIGRGGIREIELFVQTQQLVGGGRDQGLRGMTTLGVLSYLVKKQWIKLQDAETLRRAYLLFRKIEHRLQMIDDNQTHLIPEEKESFNQFVHFCDFNTAEEAIKEIEAHLRAVKNITHSFFSDKKPLGGEEGTLVFTGHDNNTDTVRTLEKMGFKNPTYIIQMMRLWHTGKYRATRSVRSRQILTEIIPILLKKISQTYKPDQTIEHMNNFMASLPAGVAFFSYLNNYPPVMDFIIEIMGAAPRLAENLAKYPETFDVMTDRHFYKLPKDYSEYKQLFQGTLPLESPYDMILTRLRRFKREQYLRIGICVIRGILPSDQMGYYIAMIAHALIELTFEYVKKEYPPMEELQTTGHFSLVGLGSFGAYSMNAQSDLDFIMVYEDHTAETHEYYTKLGKRFISALTMQTKEGILFHVDMRLRPFGNSGGLVSHRISFNNYYFYNAQIWEYCALMRASCFVGDQEFCALLTQDIKKILSKGHDQNVLRQEIHAMYKKRHQHRPAKSFWDVYLMRGGIFDLHFILHFIALSNADKISEILDHNTDDLLNKLYHAQLLTREEYKIIFHASQTYRIILNWFLLARIEYEENIHVPHVIEKYILENHNYGNCKTLRDIITLNYNKITALYQDLVEKI